MSLQELAQAAGLSADDRDLLELLLAAEGVEINENADIRRRDRTSDLPLSFAQERLWFVDQLLPGSSAYNMPAAVRMSGELDLGSLARTFDEIARRHETLRTTFEVRDHRPIQVVHEPRSLPIALLDFSALPAAMREKVALRVMRQEVGRPFDLASGPLIRILLLRTGKTGHLVLLTQHHIVSDGWSMDLLIGELATLYGAFSQGLPSPLTELPIQYADFAQWQREWLTGKVLENQLTYWKERLAGAPVLELPTDHPHTKVRSLRGSVRWADLDRSLAAELADLSRAEGATLFMTLLTAFAELLSRYCGQDDVVVGTTIANRNRRELEPLLGFFVNTLALRIDLAGRPSFRELLGRVRDTSLAAYGHQDVPFERLVGELEIERDLSRSPLFQVVFQIQNISSSGGLRLPGVALGPVQLGVETAKFDLVLNMQEGRGGALRGNWRYRSDLFEVATLARMARHLETLLAGAVKEGDRPFADLPLLSAAERQQLVGEWGAARPALVPGTGGVSLHEVFAARVAAAPESVAVVFAGEQTSYGELDRRAEELAGRLLASGLAAGEAVALFLERSTEMVVAILATLKAGGAYVPIDPGYPAERIGFTLKDCGAALVLAQGHLVPALSSAGWVGETLWVDDCAGAGPGLGGGCPEGAPTETFALRASEASPQGTHHRGRDSRAVPAVGENDLAYVIYTSGSTGRPKGVGVRHGNVLRLFGATSGWFEFGRGDTWTMFHSYAFDFSVWEMWGALLYGGRLVVVPYWVSRSPEAFWEMVCAESVTVLNQTPSAFRQLVWAEGASRESGYGLALRYVIFGGEALELGSLRPWVARHGDRRPALINMYGITETTVHVTYRRLGEAEIEAGGGSVVGRAIPDLSLVVVDREGRPVPIGVAGEMCIGGAGLAVGYVGRPELTAARFVPDGFGEEAGGRLYRSGDLGRYRLDGDLEYLGRIDQQVKVRGFRIELGEIEAALAGCPGVRESVVALKGEREEERLVGYVVPEQGSGDLDLGAVRERLGLSLPEYMVPSALVVLESLPLNANGKVDRRALPAPGSVRPETAGGYVAPTTAVEVFLAGIFGEVLKLDRVGVHDDFFALGGDSIKGAVLINRVQEEVQEIVHVVAIFDAPTVAQLASYLEREHPRAFARLWGEGKSAGEGEAAVARVDEERLALLRSLTVVPGRRWPVMPAKNRRAVFVLSPPRSGSTLLRVMLGGHPSLFAPPELELLGFGTLAERRAAFSGRGGRDRFWLEGLVRAVMESRSCSVEEAEEILATCEREGLSTGELYGRLQSWIGERVLVDKTPSYALDLGVLEKAEELFEDAFYIHLIRHPHGMIRSFEEAKLDQIFFRREHPFGRRELAELIWVASHRNIEEMLARVPAERQRAVRFEDLVREPEHELRGLCAALGLDYRQEMARPYESRRARMTDGPHAESRMLGDVKFHQYRGVASEVAERWREELAEDFLGEPTWELASALGYPREGARASDVWTRIEPGRWREEEALPLSFAQERLWFLDQLEPGSSTYNIPAALLLRGELAIESLRWSLEEIVRRHAALRTTFTTVEGRPVQIVAPAARLELPLVDLSALAERARWLELRRLVVAEAVGPFDLVTGPLLRAALVRLGRSEHAALFTLHHIVADGWSMGVLVRELGALYRSSVALPELPLQYVDFALWQRRRLQGPALEAELAYWRQTLADLVVLELPTDRPRPPVQTSRGSVWPSRLAAEHSSSLLRLGQSAGATPFMVLVAGLMALLSRLAGQEDVAVGSPLANRTRSELEPLIGFFVNTLVLRGDLRDDLRGQLSFRTLLGRVRRNVLGAFAHQELPFERIVEELQPRRDPSRTPLFQVLFALQNARSDNLELPGLTLSPLGGEGEAAKFDLTVTLSEGPGGLTGQWSFNRDLFDAATVARMSRQYERLLEGIAEVGGDEVALGDLSLLGEAERAQLLVEWSDTTTAYPREATVPELFAEQARQCPEAVVLVSDEDCLSYGELDRRSDLLARRLAALGVELESRVAICLERSLALPLAALAVLRAAAAYVPLDPGYPAERIEFLLNDTGASVVVTESRHLEKLPPELSHRLPVLCLDDDAVGAAPAAGPLPRPLPESLAYVIHTSGSTGRPKGVAVPHRAVMRLLRNTQYAELTGETFLGFAPFAFDASTFEIWAPLLNGGRLVLAPPGALSLAELGGLLTRHQVTLGFLTTGLFNQLVEEDVTALRSLRQLLTGGEALSVAHARKVLSEAPEIGLSNIYGPTENTTFTASQSLSLSSIRGGAAPLGRPIANTTVYVLDRAGRPLPVGVAGELCIGGEGLARGYFGRPELTAERFVPAAKTLGEPSGARLYLTGDLARWLPDGTFDFLGRFDGQVKLRGFRIEPGEIEAALAAHPAVRESAVLVLAAGAAAVASGDRRLVAFVVVRAGAELAGAPLREHLRQSLRQRLPEHMVPSAFVAVDALPLTANGKVDRRALAALMAQAADGEPESGFEWDHPEWDPSRTPTEELLAGIWCEVLGRERVGVEDDFFALGGHSLLATRVASRIRTVFGVELPLRKLFEAPTVAALARKIESARLAGTVPEAPAITRRAGEDDLPLSFAQQRLWFLDQLEPGKAVYNIPLPLRAAGALDPARLHASLVAVARRHESLRTRFVAAAGRPRQVIERDTRLDLPVVDLMGLPRARRDPEARALAAAEAARPFDLARGPLVRSTLLRLDERLHVVLFTLHHAIGDGWSLGILVREVTAFYRGLAAAGTRFEDILPELPIQYADFAVWQRRWLAGEVLRAELAYWRGELAGAPPVLELPADRPRPALRDQRGASWPVHLSPALSARLTALGRREGTTPFMTLLAFFQVLLARTTGEEDFCIGTPIAGRNQLATEGLIGFFVNTLVLRASLAGRPGLRELLRRVRATSLGAHEHQDLPFEKLVEELKVERSLRHTPLFQVMFALQNAPVAAFELPDLALTPLALGDERSDVAKFDLFLSLSEVGEVFSGALGFATDIFDAASAGRLAARLKVLLAAAIDDPQAPIWELPLLAEGERWQLLGEWEDPLAESSEELCLHQLFEAQAAATPDAVAAVAGDERWTYRTLNRRADWVAAALRALGCGADARVAVCAERKLPLLAALLGTLKAGAAYVPLDPAYPRERLALLLADSRAAVVLADRHLLALLPDHGAAVLALDDLMTGVGETDAPPAAVSPGNLAYLIYTSGSTGRPKGVAIEHRSAVALIGWARGLFPPTALAGVLAGTSICFDLSIFEIFLPLATGGQVILAADALALPSLPAASQVTLVNTVPSVAAALLRLGPLPAAVGTVNLAGEALRRELVAELYRQPGVRRVFNLYGPSEDTTYSTWALAAGASPRAPAIGRPIAGTVVRLLDRSLQPAPLGSPGELCLGGMGLARGYLNRPDLTAERFVPDAWGAPGSRLYRTGDLARELWDGELLFLGRLDHQVKVRGFRIEPGEVEAVLIEHPDVREAVAMALPDRRGDLQLVAFVAAGSAGLEGAADLTSHLARRLPAHLVPSRLTVLEALPLTPNGKIDRLALVALAALAASEPAAAAAGAAFGNVAEELLAGLWAEVLGVDRVGAEANFFQLGGHSLLGTQLVSRIREAFGVELPLRQLFETPTVAGLARQIEAARSLGASALAPPIVPLDPAHRGALPLSFAQERLWFLDRLVPGSAVYNLPSGFRIAGPLDVAALAAGLGEVVRRHAVLRTRFELAGDRPVQVIDPPGAPELPLVDLSGLAAELREPAARRLLLAAGARPFDLARGPLLRALLLRLGPEDHAAQLAMHHIVADGWSMTRLFAELGALYGAARERRPSPLPELAIQYADFAVWQRRYLDGEVLAAQLDYWRRELAAVPTLELPTDRPRPRVASGRGTVHTLLLPAGLQAPIVALARGEGVTLFMTLFAGLAALFHRHAGQDDVVLGTPVANRNRREIEPLIGFFVNTLVLRAGFSDDPSVRGLLARVRHTALDAYAHQDLPFERLVEELHPQRSLGRSPLFQALFALQNLGSEAPAPGFSALRLTPLAGETTTSKFDLSVSAVEGPRGLSLGFEYDADLFDAATVHRLTERFRSLLAGMIEDREAPVSGLSLLASAERHQLVHEWSAGAREQAVTESLHHLTALQLPRRGEAVALRTLAGEQVSYGELDRRASRLAARLRRLGVGPEVVVAVFLERSVDLVVAMLAIWRSGGVYLPLDTSHPPERIALLLGDSAAPVVLTVEASRPALPAGSTAVLVLDLPDDGDRALIAGEALPSSLPQSLAYVLYTSGSTGQPKGVAVQHDEAADHFRWVAGFWELREEDRVLLLASPAFDVSIEEVVPALATGATLVLGGSDLWEPGALLGRIAEQGLTVVNLSSAAWNQWAAECERRAERGDALAPEVAALRLAVVGAEAMPAEGVRAWQRTPLARARLLNGYGPTEAIVTATWQEVGPETVPPGAGTVPIGRAPAGRGALLLDRAGILVPTGVAGELCLAGRLARGYLGAPALTAERFVPDPFGRLAGGRLYRTGDLARQRADGTLEFLGRVDLQVKVRGFRIELGDVEAALASHPAVREAAVLALDEPAAPGQRRLAAFVATGPVFEPTTGRAPSRDEILAWLRDKLPRPMVPSSLTLLAALPLTANGKVDRRALARLGWAGETLDSGRERVAPRDALEQRLALLWEELLGSAPVGVRDDFFELGGHSLLAVRLLARIARELGRELPLAVLFQAPTIEGLAALLRDGDPDLVAAAGSPLVTLGSHRAATAGATGGERPFFCVHPIGGSVFCYRELARRLGPGRPFYALQARGLGAAEEPRERVEEMAASYLAALRTVQPAGPYLLGGWSFGGLVALEMARQLQAAGERVDLLALFDPTTVAAAVVAPVVDEAAVQRAVAEDLGGLAGPAGEMVADPQLPHQRLTQLYGAHLRATVAYRLTPYSGRISLFLPAASGPRDTAPVWAAVATGGLAVTVVPGDHYSMLREPQVEELAQRLAGLMVAAPASAGGRDAQPAPVSA